MPEAGLNCPDSLWNAHCLPGVHQQQSRSRASREHERCQPITTKQWHRGDGMQKTQQISTVCWWRMEANYSWNMKCVINAVEQRNEENTMSFSRCRLFKVRIYLKAFFKLCTKCILSLFLATTWLNVWILRCLSCKPRVVIRPLLSSTARYWSMILLHLGRTIVIPMDFTTNHCGPLQIVQNSAARIQNTPVVEKLHFLASLLHLWFDLKSPASLNKTQNPNVLSGCHD